MDLFYFKIKAAPAEIPKPKKQVDDSQNYYHLWSHNLTMDCPNNRRKNSECSTLSTSPTSSIESNTSNEANETFFPSNKRKLELPSKKAMNKLADFSCFTSAPSKTNACCSFCKNNGEPKHIYSTHSIKDSNGKITCPLLKIYKCPICGESGQNAHTITYCKQYKLARRNNILNSFKN